MFYINLPFGAVAIAMMWRYLQEERPTARAKIDYLGALTITLSIAALMLALLQVGEGARWLLLEVMGLMAAAVVILRFPSGSMTELQAPGEGMGVTAQPADS